MAIRDTSGKPIRMIGAHTDVTALKAQKAENLKQEREQKIAFQQQFAASLQDNAVQC